MTDVGSAFTGKRSRNDRFADQSSNEPSDRLINAHSNGHKDGTQEDQKPACYLSATNLAALDNGSSAADTMS